MAVDVQLPDGQVVGWDSDTPPTKEQYNQLVDKLVAPNAPLTGAAKLEQDARTALAKNPDLTDVKMSGENMPKALLNGLRILLQHPGDTYMKSVDQAFGGSNLPQLPVPQAPADSNAAIQIQAAIAGVAPQIINGGLTAGGASLANPVTALAAVPYTAPYFAIKGAEAIGSVFDSKKSVQERASGAIMGPLMLAGGVHGGIKGVSDIKESIIPQVNSAGRAGTVTEANAKANQIALKADPFQSYPLTEADTPQAVPPLVFQTDAEAAARQEAPKAQPTGDATSAQASIEAAVGLTGEKKGLSVEDVVALANDPRTDPAYRDKIIAEANARILADKAAGVTEDKAPKAADTVLADRVKQSQTNVSGASPPNSESAVSGPNLGELVGQDVHFNGYVGKLIRDDEGNFGVLQGVTYGKPHLVEVPDTGKDPLTSAKDVGIAPIIKMEGILGRGIADTVEPRSSLPNAKSFPEPVPALPLSQIAPEAKLTAVQARPEVSPVTLPEPGAASGVDQLPKVKKGTTTETNYYSQRAAESPTGKYSVPSESKRNPVIQNPKESDADYRIRLLETTSKRANRALASPSVDILAKDAIRSAIADATGKETSDISDANVAHLSNEELSAVHNKIDALTSEGSNEVKTRELARQQENNSIQSAIDESGSRPIEKDPKLESVGQRLSIGDKLTQYGKNKAIGVRNALRSGLEQVLNRDVTFNNLDANNPDGPMQNIFGAKIDVAYQKEQNLKADWKAPIIEAIKGKELDKTSMERVNIYALDRMDQANPDVPNTHLADSGIDPAVLEDIRNNGLTKEEMAFYNAARDVLDNKSFRAVSDTMHNEFNVDVTKLKDYWPSQRDYSKVQSKVQRPEMLAENGSEAAIDDLKNSLQNDFRHTTTSNTNKGQTIEKQEGAGGAINLSQNLIDRHLNQAAHIVAFSHDVKQLGSIARKPSFADKYGVGGQKYVNDWLDSVARDADPVGATRNTTADAAIRATSVGILAVRFLSQIKHISNVVIATRELGGPSAVVEGLTQSLTKEGRDFIKQNFPEVYQRAGGEQAISDMLTGGKYAKTQAAFFLPERIIDQHLARASVLGAYMKELAAKGIDPATYADIPVDAKAQAKALVSSRKVVTSSLRKDAPQALSRGTLTGGNMTLRNAIFQFQSTMLKNAGYFKNEFYDKGLQQGEYKAAATAAATMFGVLAVVSALTLSQKKVMDELFGKGGAKGQHEPEPPEALAEEIAVEGLRQVPVIGPVVGSTVTRGESGIPVLDTYVSGVHAIGQYAGLANDAYGRPVKGKAKDKAAIDAAAFAGTALGIPGASTVGQALKRTAK